MECAYYFASLNGIAFSRPSLLRSSGTRPLNAEVDLGVGGASAPNLLRS